MSAARYDITIEQGADYALALNLKDSTGAAINITGATVQAHIREKWDGPKVAEFAAYIVNATQGKIALYLYANQNVGLSPFAAFYDVLLIRANGIRQRIVQGTVTISHAITHV